MQNITILILYSSVYLQCATGLQLLCVSLSVSKKAEKAIRKYLQIQFDSRFDITQYK